MLFRSWDPDNEIDQTVNFVSFMVQEVRDISKGLSSENSILMRMGARMPPPEPYSGEPDLKRYQVFITGLLQWFLMNQLLGSDAESTLMQLKCLVSRYGFLREIRVRIRRKVVEDVSENQISNSERESEGLRKSMRRNGGGPKVYASKWGRSEGATCGSSFGVLG